MKTPTSLPRRLARHFWRECIRPLALPMLLITAAKSALADINYVPSGSMQPTILAGDVVFIDKLAYDFRVPFTFARVARWADPARGDIVVCFAPDDGTRLVKRVIGLPGDTIELRNDTLVINGVGQTYGALPESTTQHLDPAERSRAVFATEELDGRVHAVMALPTVPALRDFGPMRIPAGSYFMMGDNRDNSRDSRFFGVVPRHAIIGRVKGVFVSGDLDHWLRPRGSRFFSALE
ncbi:MAG TPA: signal peptidase I [Opitutaceae bacterium]|nr:signal peptidase I [Opitutaceae bacterium]